MAPSTLNISSISGPPHLFFGNSRLSLKQQDQSLVYEWLSFVRIMGKERRKKRIKSLTRKRGRFILADNSPNEHNLKLLDKVREAIRTRHYSRRTEKAYSRLESG